MLMLRISYVTFLGCSTLILWLQLLHEYFEELLQKPISKLEAGQDECLEGSPFLLGLSNGELDGMHSFHLQRQTLLLFLRCCFSLMSFTGETSKQCVTSKTILKSCLTVASVSDLDYCSRNKGLLELYNWLQGHLPDDILVDHERYLEKCMGFSLSFLQLYMHEVCHLTHQELFFLNFGSFSVCKLDTTSLILDFFSYIFSLSWILHWGFCALIALSTMKCRMMYYLWSFCNC
jgi:hypothetical protein